MIKVAVAGAAGRMGETVCRAVEDADDMRLSGRADPALGCTVADVLADADVLVDFTIPDTAVENARQALAAGVHVVIGTTGFDVDSSARSDRRQHLRRPQLRHRRGADDAVRRRGGQAHGPRGDHRAPPRPQARQAERNGGTHGER